MSKSVGVLLHDSGFMRYRRLTAENYDYWWYESEDPLTANPRHFTYQWADMERTSKFNLLAQLANFHKPDESLWRLINNTLNIIEAMGDGINTRTGELAWVEVFAMLYPQRKNQQLTLFV